MPKPELLEPYRALERDIVDAMFKAMNGYPHSHSDLEWCARELMERFEIQRRSQKIALPKTSDPLF